MAIMTVKDVEQVQTTLREAGLDYQLELEQGKISVMGLSDIISSEAIAVYFSFFIPSF